MILCTWMKKRTERGLYGAMVIVSVIIDLVALFPMVDAADGKQKGFASPKDAALALVEAVRHDDKESLFAILGTDAQGLIGSGDEIQDRADRDHFVRAYGEKHFLENEGEEKALLFVGDKDWPFPIPIIKKGQDWVFDTKGGKEEILNRRIGRNELTVIEILMAYADAQREYASKDRNGDGILEYAQKIASDSGKQDGLYWEAKEERERSPFGPLVARAARDGYQVPKGKDMGQPIPYYGYLYRILKGQGNHAARGAADYVVNGKMVLGFALLAYPARYGSSGIMTFMVNQDGVVHEKDLGKDTAAVVDTIKIYDPDPTWKKVSPH